MKLLLISLALAIFAGSQAMVIREAPDQGKQTKLSKYIHEWEEFLEGLNNATDKRFEQFKHSKTGKVLMELLDDEEEKGKEAQKEDEDIIEAAIDTLGDIFEKLVLEMEKEALPAIKKFHDAVEAVVGHHLDAMIEKVEPHVEYLFHALVNKTHELDHKLDEVFPQQLEVLDSHAPQFLTKLFDEDSKQKTARK